jgi:RHS repeat-associated protein
MVYNDGDQLVKWPGMYRYSYDGAGNLVQVRNDSQTQVLKSYTYTPAGLLATATYRDKDGNTRTLTNTWDADSNRVSFDANGTEYELVYDTTAGIPAVLEESTSGSTAYYIREPGGGLIARVHPTDGIRHYHFDELGSTRLLTDADGDMTDGYAYDAYGSLLSHDCYSGSVNQPYQYVGQLGYYTHYQEPEFGLLQLGVRFYDAELGRFTQRDPARQGLNAEYYVGGNPTSRIDPAGLWAGGVPDAFFSWHYLFGGRTPVDLWDVGFMDDYRRLGAVKSAVRTWRLDTRMHVIQQAKVACRKNPFATNVVTSYDSGPEHREQVTVLDFGWVTVAEHSLYMKSLCLVKVDCCKRTFRFECILDFRMHDYWADTLGIGVGLGGFSIDGAWWEEFGGTDSF